MLSWWQKSLAVAAGLVGLAGGVYYLLMRRPLPRKRGNITLDGLHAPVEVITDCFGIPHIYAQNEDDLFFAQGYIHAQDRFWQMELNRRVGSGRLSEVFGKFTLEADRLSRRLGMHRSAAIEASRLPEHSKRILEAYARGVNTYIARNKRNLPLEFKLLRFKPGPWQIADSILWAKMMGWNLGGNWETEIIRARIIEKLGTERAAKLEAGYDPTHPLIIPSGVAYQGVNLGMLEQYEQLKELSGFGLLGASNNWVVDGTMTTTGAPILCNDPHLAQTAPSIWYECHLVADNLNVVGASFPGTPGIVIGHNQHIAWGVTNAISDIQDLYIEKFNPQNPNQYEYQGRWEEAQVIREEIKVRGRKSPVIEEVRITRHGPIITNISPSSDNRVGQNGKKAEITELPLALTWTGLEQCQVITSVEKLNRATDWEEFRAALRYWDVPPQNVVYADVEGNIGYVMAGAIPVRSQGQHLLPLPGWTGEYEWTGYIPFDELPQAYNPQQHFIVTANNRVIDDSYPYYITNEWLNGYRAQRIRDLLTSKDRLSPADMATIQADQYALPALEIVPHMLRIQPQSPLEKAALDILRTWDYMLAPDSVGATVYEMFLLKLQLIIFGTVFGGDDTLLYHYLGRSILTLLAMINGYTSRSRPLLIRLMNEHDDSWFADSAIPNGPTSWDAATGRAFTAATEELREQLGSDISRWQYGKLHTITYNHPLGMVKPLNKIVNRGPYPYGGDIDTVNMGASLPGSLDAVITVPSYRQIVNLADMKHSRSGHAPGQSGHPASKHYADLIKSWLHVKHHPMLFERSEVEAHAEATLWLSPRSDSSSKI